MTSSSPVRHATAASRRRSEARGRVLERAIGQVANGIAEAAA